MAEDHDPADAVTPPTPRVCVSLPRQSFHVASHHAPKPRLRVVPTIGPPRTVTYAGVEFEVMFDGTPQRAIVEEP